MSGLAEPIGTPKVGAGKGQDDCKRQSIPIDVIAHIISHVDPVHRARTLFNVIRISRAVYNSLAWKLYVELELKPHQPHDPLLAYDRRPLPPSKAGNREPVNLLTKTELLAHVKLLVVWQHSTGWCEALGESFPSLPRLEVLGLKKAARSDTGSLHADQPYSSSCRLLRGLSPGKIVTLNHWAFGPFSLLERLPSKTRSSVTELTILESAECEEKTTPTSWPSCPLVNLTQLNILFVSGVLESKAMPFEVGDAGSLIARLDPDGVSKRIRCLAKLFMAHKSNILFVNEEYDVSLGERKGAIDRESILCDVKDFVTRRLRTEKKTADEIAAAMSKFRSLTILEYLEKGDILGEFSDTEVTRWMSLLNSVEPARRWAVRKKDQRGMR